MTTLDNAAAVLSLFGSDRAEISVTETHRLLGMPKSSAARLLQNMRHTGFLDPVGRGPRYQLGSLVFQLAQQDRARTPLADLAENALSKICTATGHTGYVSVLDGTEIVVLRCCRGTRALQVVTPLGQRMPAAGTAIGRALLARLPDDSVRERYANWPAATSHNSPQTLNDLLHVLGNGREQGCSESSDEAVPGVGSTAVAVVDQDGGEMLGFCVSYSASDISADEKSEVSKLLTDAATAVGRRVNDEFWSQGTNDRSPAGAVKSRRGGAVR